VTVSSIILYFLLSFFLLAILLPLIRLKNRIVCLVIKGILIVSVMFVCYQKISTNCAPIPYEPANNPWVYSTNAGSHYHHWDCGYLWNSSHKISLCDATIDNLSPCSRCNPPEYSAELKTKIKDSLKSRGPAIDEFLLSIEYISCAALLTVLWYISFRFKFLHKIHLCPGSYISSSLNCMIILSSIFFLPGIIIAGFHLYTIAGIVALLSVPIGKVFSSCKRRKQNASPNLIKCDIPTPSQYHTTTTPQPPPETYYYMEAANGMTVRVPESKLEAWQAAQDELRQNPDSAKLTPEEEELKTRILDYIYSEESDDETGNTHTDG